MDCITKIGKVKYEKFSEALHGQAMNERVPLNGIVELTLRCNLNCLHCYRPRNLSSHELTSFEFYRIIDKISDAGCLWLTFTGGEPLLREDFLDIYTYAKKKGLIPMLFTNGTLISPKIADCLEEYPPFYIEISLYGATQKTYENITGVKGSFKKCLEGIDLLLERKIPLKLKTMVLTINKHEINQMEEFARGLGLDFRVDPIIHPRFDGSKIPCQFRMAPREAVKFDTDNKRRYDFWIKLLEEYEYNPRQFEHIIYCQVGRFSFHIDPYGKMMPCMMLRDFKYDLLSGSFKEGWDLFLELINKKSSLEFKCRTCPIYIYCDCCPGWSILEEGDIQAPVEYLCKIAHLREQEFKKKFIGRRKRLCRKKDIKDLIESRN